MRNVLNSTWFKPVCLLSAVMLSLSLLATVCIAETATAVADGGDAADGMPLVGDDALVHADEYEQANNGQDATRPLARLDLRPSYENLPGGNDLYALTIRMDLPFQLNESWVASTRFDLPVLYSDVPSRDNPNGDYETGTGDALFQTLFIKSVNPKWRVAPGFQVLTPLGSQDQFGTGRWQLVPTFAVARDLNEEVSPGSFAAILVRNQFSVGGDDREDVNRILIQPLLNFNLEDNWFVTVNPELIWNVETGSDDWFIPASAVLGKLINPKTVASVEVGVPIVDDYEQYDFQVEFRVGFFF